MKKVLVIDDDPGLRADLLDILGFEGYQGLGAATGREGVSVAAQYQPDLIICDVTMPDLDGFGVLVELRQNPQCAHIPVIFLSGQKEPSMIERGLQLGAADYLAKPYALSDLLASIHARIGD